MNCGSHACNMIDYSFLFLFSGIGVIIWGFVFFVLYALFTGQLK